jgi:hypothetical protein
MLDIVCNLARHGVIHMLCSCWLEAATVVFPDAVDIDLLHVLALQEFLSNYYTY